MEKRNGLTQSIALGDEENASAPDWTKKESDAKRAEATERAAVIYLERKRSGNETGVSNCCDIAATETGYPRPAESSVRRMIPKLMTIEEKREKQQKDAKADRRAEATKRAAEIYREMNGNIADGEDVVMSVTKCCEMVMPDYGVRPAESSLRRMLSKMYEEEGIEPPKPKKARPSPSNKTATPAAAAAAAAASTNLMQPNHDPYEHNDKQVLLSAAGLIGQEVSSMPPLPSPLDDIDIVGV